MNAQDFGGEDIPDEQRGSMGDLDLWDLRVSAGWESWSTVREAGGGLVTDGLSTGVGSLG